MRISPTALAAALLADACRSAVAAWTLLSSCAAWPCTPPVAPFTPPSSPLAVLCAAAKPLSAASRRLPVDCSSPDFTSPRPDDSSEPPLLPLSSRPEAAPLTESTNPATASCAAAAVDCTPSAATRKQVF